MYLPNVTLIEYKIKTRSLGHDKTNRKKQKKMNSSDERKSQNVGPLFGTLRNILGLDQYLA